MKPGITLAEIGQTIQNSITSHGFAPIKNLSGHGVGRFLIHSSPTIPNFNTGDSTQLEEDQIIAVEPFATNGIGMIYESDNATIFSLIEKKPVRSPITRDIMKEVETFENLPFTTRWLTKKFPPFKVNFALRELLQIESIRKYPPLPDRKHGLVSQAEHTVIVKDEPIITTL